MSTSNPLELLLNDLSKPMTEERKQRMEKAIEREAKIISNWESGQKIGLAGSCFLEEDVDVGSTSNPSEPLPTEVYKRMTAEEENRIKETHDQARLIASMTFEEFMVWSEPPPFIYDERPITCVPNTWKKYFGWLEEEASNFHVVDDDEWFGDNKERELALIHDVVIPAYHEAQKLLPHCQSLSEAISKALKSRLHRDSSIPLIVSCPESEEVDKSSNKKFPELFGGPENQKADGSLIQKLIEPESVLWEDDPYIDRENLIWEDASSFE